MKTAREIFDATSKDGLDEYFAALDALGARGKLAAHLLLTQRASDRLWKAMKNPTEGDRKNWLRYKHLQMNMRMDKLIEFCSLTRSTVPFTLRTFSYGKRIKIKRVPALRFYAIKDGWKADARNVSIILDLCDRLVSHDRRDDATGQVFAWPATL